MHRRYFGVNNWSFAIYYNLWNSYGRTKIICIMNNPFCSAHVSSQAAFDSVYKEEVQDTCFIIPVQMCNMRETDAFLCAAIYRTEIEGKKRTKNFARCTSLQSVKFISSLGFGPNVHFKQMYAMRCTSECIYKRLFVSHGNALSKLSKLLHFSVIHICIIREHRCTQVYTVFLTKKQRCNVKFYAIT